MLTYCYFSGKHKNRPPKKLNRELTPLESLRGGSAATKQMTVALVGLLGGQNVEGHRKHEEDRPGQGRRVVTRSEDRR
jgi:hypothetical protein